MRFFVDGRQRPLDSFDVPGQALPYADITLNDSKSDLTDGSLYAKVFTDSDWGAGKNFYLSQLILVVTDATEFMTAADYSEGFIIQLNSTIAPAEVWYYKSIHKPNNGPILAGSNWILGYVYTFSQLREVLSTQTLQYYVENHSGETVSLSLYLNGIPK